MGAIRGIKFVVVLYGVAVCGLLVGSGDLYEKSKFWLHGARGYMQSSDPDLAQSVKYGLQSPMVDVSYVTPAGRVELVKKTLTADLARRLNAGQRIPVYFLTNKPEHALYDYQEPEQPWGWLIVGVAALFTARYALRLYKREMHGADAAA